MSEKHKKVFKLLWVFSYALLACVSVGITSSAVGLKICALTTAIKMQESIIKKKRRKHDKIVLLAKTKLSAIKVLIFNALLDSNFNHDEFVPVNNVLREYNEVREEIESPRNAVEYTIYAWLLLT